MENCESQKCLRTHMPHTQTHTHMQIQMQTRSKPRDATCHKKNNTKRECECECESEKKSSKNIKMAKMHCNGKWLARNYKERSASVKIGESFGYSRLRCGMFCTHSSQFPSSPVPLFPFPTHPPVTASASAPSTDAHRHTNYKRNERVFGRLTLENELQSPLFARLPYRQV